MNKIIFVRNLPYKITIEEIDAAKNAEGFIFDGFPRTAAQAESLDKMLLNKTTSISMMLALEVEEEELIERLLNRGKDSGRPDDQDEVIIRKRITEYTNKTAPLKDFYTKQGKFHRVDGEGSIEETFEKLESVIDTRIVQ